MSEILETVMLICFGFSWPINLVKNVKAKTAKTMSLKFILLIILGYIAGIASKLIAHRFNYVLVVYLINLAIVSVNLAVYFINRNYDRKQDAVHPNQESESMQTKHELSPQELKFAQMNTICHKGGVVFFGSDYFSDYSLDEISESMHVNEYIYNRSIKHKTISQMNEMFSACVDGLAPKKVFVNLGEYDLELPGFDAGAFISRYEWLLYTINQTTSAKIYIVSIVSENENAVVINKKLKQLSKQYGCSFVDISGTSEYKYNPFKVFDVLKPYIRTRQISFADAFNSVTA